MICHQEVFKYETEVDNYLSLQELYALIQALQIESEFYSQQEEKKLSEDEEKSLQFSNKNRLLLNDEIIRALKSIFFGLDSTGNGTVSRLDFIEEIRRISQMKEILLKPAISLEPINQTMSFDKLLAIFEQEQYYGSEEEQMGKETIRWKDFEGLLYNYHKRDILPKEQLLYFKQIWQKPGDSCFAPEDIIELEKNALSFFSDIFHSVPLHWEQFAEKKLILNAIRRNVLYSTLALQLARKPPENSDSINSLLDYLIFWYARVSPRGDGGKGPPEN